MSQLRIVSADSNIEIENLISNIRAKQPQPKPTGIYERRGRFHVSLSINGARQFIGSYKTRQEAEEASIAARLANPAKPNGMPHGSRVRQAIKEVCADQDFMSALWSAVQACKTRTDVAYAVGFRSLSALNSYLDRRGITEEFERRWRSKKCVSE